MAGGCGLGLGYCREEALKVTLFSMPSLWLFKQANPWFIVIYERFDKVHACSGFICNYM